MIGSVCDTKSGYFQQRPHTGFRMHLFSEFGSQEVIAGDSGIASNCKCSCGTNYRGVLRSLNIQFN